MTPLPEEVASSFVFLASDDSPYMTGQVLHPNGDEAKEFQMSNKNNSTLAI